MGIAVRLWTSEDLKKVLGGDRWLTTLLANAKTRDKAMSDVIFKVQSKVKRYVCTWAEGFDSITDIYATDDEMLLKFLDADYTERPVDIMEVITTYRTVNPQEKVAA